MNKLFYSLVSKWSVISVNMKFVPTLLVIYCLLLNKSISSKGKYTKNLHNAKIVYPVQVSNEGNLIEDQKLDQRFKRSKISQEPMIHYKISIKGNTEYIDLIPNSKIFSPGAILEVRTNDSSAPDQLSSVKTKLISDQQCIYTGKVRAFQDSSVALSTCYGLCGFIRMKRHTFFIEPVSYNANDWKGQPHVLYQTLHNEDSMQNCAVDEKTPQKTMSTIHRRKQATFSKNSASLKNNHSRSVPLHLETLLVLDNAMIKSHLRNDLENYVLTVLNMAQSLFNNLIHEPSINIELVRILQLLDDTEELNFKEKRSADEVLETFSKWQNLINPKSDTHPYHHDIAILITGNDICDRKGNCHFLGIAEKNGVCKPNRQAVLCKDNGLLLGYTLAHEIAHNLGIEHDTGYNSCSPKMSDGSSSIMSPTITFNSREWTGCSHDSITSSLESGDLSCLEDDPNTGYSNLIDVLPGFIYGADFQCKRLFNKNAMDCSLSEGDCKSLKCQFKETSCTNTGVPPAPGTSCGQNKWCCDGECVQVGKHPKAVHGGWGSWSKWSTCSRSCGSGISASVRECNNPTPIHGGKTCNGRRKRHKLCSTEPCPVGSNSFRDVQCAKYNDWLFPEDGKHHNWKGFFINGGDPCALTCKNEKNVVVSVTPKVIDGTTCYRGLRDICVDGVCKNVPCDLQLDSNSVQDECGICHGNGTGCRVLQGTKTGLGLKNVLPSIPAGTRNIRVKALTKTGPKLLVKAVNNKEQFNDGKKLGMFKVPGSVAWLGMSKPNEELLEIPGPIDMPINIWVKSDGLQTVSYSMALPSDPREGKYYWDYIDWLPCKSQCGEGIQEAEPKCIEIMSGHVEDQYCKLEEKPKVQRRSCDAGPCFARWLVGEWQDCGPCPSREARRFRIVRCIKPVAGIEEGISIIQSEECPGRRPASFEHCQCLKRQASYWPPHYHSHFSSINLKDVPIKSYKIRKTRSTKIPEKKVTLMQLENESEESMLKQFEENQNKHNPYLYIPNLFGSKLNFTIPLKKRQATLFYESSTDNDSNEPRNESLNDNAYGNSLSELEKYFVHLLSSLSSPMASTDNEFIRVPNSGNFNVADIAHFTGLDSKNKHTLSNANIQDYSVEDNSSLLKEEPPLNFSDQNISKILSDNLALHKLKEHQNMKYNQYYSKLPFDKLLMRNNFDMENLNFLHLIGNQLYEALEMQPFLQNLLNSSQNKYEIEQVRQKSANVNHSNQSFMRKHRPTLLSLNKQPVLENKKEQTDLSYSDNCNVKNGPNEILKQFNTSNSKFYSSTDAKNEVFSALYALRNRKLNLNEFFMNILKSEFKPCIISNSIDLYRKQENPISKNEIFPLSQMKGPITKNTPVISEKKNLYPKIGQLGYRPSHLLAYSGRALHEFGSNENMLVDEISDKLRHLSFENKIRLYNDLVSIIEYLNYLLSYSSINNNNLISSGETINDESYFNNIKGSYQDNFYKKTNDHKQTNSKRKNNKIEISELTDSLFEKINNNHDRWTEQTILQQNETVNRLLDKLNYLYNQLCYNERDNNLNIHLPIMKKRNIVSNERLGTERVKHFTNSVVLDSLISESNNNIFQTGVAQNEDLLKETDFDQCAEIVGPLKSVYSIPEGRECKSTSTTEHAFKEPYRIKRGVTYKSQDNLCRSIKNYPASKATIKNRLLSVNKISQIDHHNMKDHFINKDKNYKNNIITLNDILLLKEKGRNNIPNQNYSQLISCDELSSISINPSLDNTEPTAPSDLEEKFKTDIFYSPPGFYDKESDDKHVKCLDNLVLELQKELQLMRHRQCTGCYYVYKDQPTRKCHKGQ